VQDVEDSLAEAAVQAADSCWGGACPGVQLLSREGRVVTGRLREFVAAALEEAQLNAAAGQEGDENDEQGCEEGLG
jgi:hypothetical protein